MSMELAFAPDAGFLRVRVTGWFVLDDANDALARMLEAVAEGGATRVLVDCIGLEGVPTTTERFEHSRFAAERLREYWARGLLGSARFAYVARVPLADRERFGETVAVNRGVDVRTFEREEDAVRWLEGGRPDEVVKGGAG